MTTKQPITINFPGSYKRINWARVASFIGHIWDKKITVPFSMKYKREFDKKNCDKKNYNQRKFGFYFT